MVLRIVNAYRVALLDLNLTFDRGSLTVLMGPSGSGKTALQTTMGCLRESHSG
ncbi:hypothetical protein RISW2_16900 [Roseivivax isoporae LMG 25204]|uniref:ABC transporter domain-containing protein n=1 Tax=Roseivivax isoporae LMG 25204 TaxID=1449351 RepID=X7F4P0_9RHOB|nr:hypothetical protein RISW2_16900 [Roseivivax isoporae LMG 25204]